MKRKDYFVLHHEDTIEDLRRDTDRLLSKINAMSSSERNQTHPDLVVAIHIEGRSTVSIFKSSGELADYCDKLDLGKNTLGWVRLSELSEVASFASAAKVMRGHRWQRMIRLGFETKPLECNMTRAA